MVGPERFSKIALYIALAAALLGMLLLPSEAAAEPPRALLTIADGPVELLRGAARHGAAEGLALADNDIVRTLGSTRVARIEFADGRVLDLGPDTQALLLSDRAAASQGLGSATVLMIQGWAKLAMPAAVNAGVGPFGSSGRLAAPRLAVTPAPAGSVLLRVEPDGDALVFAEVRGATVWRRPAAGQDATVDATLREGEVWSRQAASATGTVSVGAATPALKRVPRALADTLPRRAARFDGRTVEAAAGEALEPRDLAPWLRAEPALLAALRPRQTALAREATQARGSTVARKPSALASAAARPAARNVREPKVLAGLAPPPEALPTADTPSIALEPTALLTTEKVQAAVPPIALASLPTEPPPARPAASTRPTRPAASNPITATATAGSEAPKRR
jgi:hypothetical protein